MTEGKKKKKSWWLWPGLLTTAVAGAAVVLFRGCWHRRMSWPVRAQDCCYQVCLGCGIKRLFDESTFRAYGPYSYDLDRLLRLVGRRNEPGAAKDEPGKRRPAS